MDPWYFDITYCPQKKRILETNLLDGQAAELDKYSNFPLGQPLSLFFGKKYKYHEKYKYLARNANIWQEIQIFSKKYKYLANI